MRETVPDDAQLIQSVVDGDAAAFGDLVQRYQDRLFNSLVHAVGSREEAEDVAQEAFVMAFRKLGTFQRQSAFYSWLYRIARNVAISRHRRQRPVCLAPESLDAATPRTRDVTSQPVAELERKETVAQIRLALSRLHEEHRTILILREIDGCDYETIGLTLELPIGTVRSRLFRARQELRELLREVNQQENA